MDDSCRFSAFTMLRAGDTRQLAVSLEIVSAAGEYCPIDGNDDKIALRQIWSYIVQSRPSDGSGWDLTGKLSVVVSSGSQDVPGVDNVCLRGLGLRHCWIFQETARHYVASYYSVSVDYELDLSRYTCVEVWRQRRWQARCAHSTSISDGQGENLIDRRERIGAACSSSCRLLYCRVWTHEYGYLNNVTGF